MLVDEGLQPEPQPIRRGPGLIATCFSAVGYYRT
jgi:hypothetical protein